jgi:curved DNA-binding protein CbpA
MATPRHKKQHDARAASFKRIAKGYRQVAKECHPVLGNTIRKLAKVKEAEAALLRSMR